METQLGTAGRAVCPTCGTFLLEGREGSCPPCASKRAARAQVLREARLVAACLGLTALTILGPTELAAFDQSAWLFPLIVAGPLIVGLVLTLLMRNPWPPLAALGVFAVWPPWWILVAAGLWRLGAIVGLLWCVSVATAIRMALTRRRLKALLGRDA